jgi:hypothetical protein
VLRASLRFATLRGVVLWAVSALSTTPARLALGRACDNACVFCAQEGLPRDSRPDEEILAALAQLKEGSDRVTFTGGEPGIDGRLESMVARAKSAGFSGIGVQTNGRALAVEGKIERLRRAGLTDVHLSLHGAEARVHDWCVGVSGAFDHAVRTLRAARAAALEVVVVTVVAKPNFRVLAPIARLLSASGVTAWCLDVPSWRGRAATAADRVIPRLALALPFGLHAVDVANASGLPVFLRGAPSCLLGPFARFALSGSPRAYGKVCETCASRGVCPGVDAEYLARYGEGELAPCATVARDGRHERLRAMFVGPGEMAPPIDAAHIHPPPERARVSLPMLGRPAPAVAEVPGSAPKQSGESLRAILPGLFDGTGAKNEDPED